MKSKLQLLSLMAVMLLLVSCGASDKDKKNALTQKREELGKLKAEQKQLTEKIAQLEEEIERLDPNSGSEVKTIAVSAEEVGTGKFEHFVTVQGQLESDKVINVATKRPDLVVTRVLVDEGQNVRAGQVLAEHDNSVMVKALAELEASLDLAKTLYEKRKRLWDQGIGTEVEYLTAKNQVESLENRIATTKSQMSMTRITAPYSGVVDKVHVKVGQNVNPMTGAFTLVNLSELTFKAELSENYIPYVKKGTSVKVKFPTVKETVDAKITNVGQTIHPVNRTITLDVKMPKGEDNLRANMIGEMSINDYEADSAVIVPASYIVKAEGGYHVFLAEETEQGWVAKKVDVKPGMTYKGRTEILSGLKGGEKLITQGYQKMTDGQSISL